MQRLSIYQAIRKFIPGSLIDLCDCRPGYPHLLCTLLMGPLFQINQTNRLIFIHGHMYPFASQYSFWPKAVISRLYADSSASCWSCHCISLPSFPSYVDNYHTSILCRSQWVDSFWLSASSTIVSKKIFEIFIRHCYNEPTACGVFA